MKLLACTTEFVWYRIKRLQPRNSFCQAKMRVVYLRGNLERPLKEIINGF
jgi:hypothetical protein